MSVNDNLRQLIRKYIKEVLKELEETSFSSGAGAYNTPFAFSGGGKKDKKKKKNVSTICLKMAIQPIQPPLGGWVIQIKK